MTDELGIDPIMDDADEEEGTGIGPNPILCRCLEITQPIGTFYVGVLDSRELQEIVKFDIREYKELRLVESISGIERPLKRARVLELSKYVNMLDASFPTGIILAMSSRNARFKESTRTLEIARKPDVARVLDGQHRIWGLKEFRGQKFEVNVTVFVDMEMEEQALLFSTINLKQTPVEGSLVYDLYEYAKSRSPQRTCHTIARVLNKDDGPFRNRIMILGHATGQREESLTQAAFVKPLLALISADPAQDRDDLKRGRPLSLTGPEKRTRRLVFRQLFIEERDDEIADVLSDYFGAVQRRWREAWDIRAKGLILNRTTGYRALMRFLPFVIFHLKTQEPTSEQLQEVFEKVTLKWDEFTPETFKPGTGGEAALLRRLMANTGINESEPWKGLTAS
jgi:DGQHR domain-containing protein